ncbi:hypothetical protein E8D34_13770 [Nocardioides sp. GY 10113]|uniref:hypothetical protein n=1 Tax=Nocardioides sp. GY 10113 TaxID=2569761 RepID=UPI0010A8D8A6|nr:hypothetical protein [Nocardioides sp. GY 10113]TIC85131.1 hypothetical protein E8D34_13770 [Nocardioides sp. GY 10113]
MGWPRRALGAAVAGTVVYGVAVRPRLRTWGATAAEVNGPFPGADVIRGGRRGATMATTIEAPPEEVWPWLVQLGGDRAGWYSWDHLDNGGRPSARHVHPEWQHLEVGDHVKYWTNAYGAVDAWEVVRLEPERFLGLYGASDLLGNPLRRDDPRPYAWSEGLWGFDLRPLPGGRTRLVIGGYEAFYPDWVGRVVGFLFPAMVWVMQARMLKVLKHNVERAAGHPDD